MSARDDRDDPLLYAALSLNFEPGSRPERLALPYLTFYLDRGRLGPRLRPIGSKCGVVVAFRPDAHRGNVAAALRRLAHEVDSWGPTEGANSAK